METTRQRSQSSLWRRLAPLGVLACLMGAMCIISENPAIAGPEEPSLFVRFDPANSTLPTDAFFRIPIIRVPQLRAIVGDVLPSIDLFFKDVILGSSSNTSLFDFRVIEGTLVPPEESVTSENVFDSTTGILRLRTVSFPGGGIDFGPTCFQRIGETGIFRLKRVFVPPPVVTPNGFGLTQPAQVFITTPAADFRLPAGEAIIEGEVFDESCEADSVTVTVTVSGPPDVMIDSRTVELGLNSDFKTPVLIRRPNLGEEPPVNLIHVRTNMTAFNEPGSVTFLVTGEGDIQQQPTITITSPEANELLPVGNVTVTGTVTDPLGLADGAEVNIILNEETEFPATLDGDSFVVEVPIGAGENDISAIVRTADGRIGVDQIFVTGETPQGFAVSLEVLPRESGLPLVSGRATARGAVVDPTGTITRVLVTINDGSCSTSMLPCTQAVDPDDGSFSRNINLRPGDNSVAATITTPDGAEVKSEPITSSIPTTPVITITELTGFAGESLDLDNPSTMEGSVTIEGTVFPLRGILTTLEREMSVTVNGEAGVDAGNFEPVVPNIIVGDGMIFGADNIRLELGENNIILTATTSDGQEGTAEITVIKEEPPPRECPEPGTTSRPPPGCL